VTELAEPFEVSLPGISKHLRVLEKAGLLTRKKEGRIRRCRLVAGPMKDAAQWITVYRHRPTIRKRAIKRSPNALNLTLSALADPTRRAILERLACEESSVTELAGPFRVSLPAISKHLRVLEKAGLLARKKDGRIHHCSLVAGPLQDIAEWIARYRRFWEEQFDALADYLNESEEKEDP